MLENCVIVSIRESLLEVIINFLLYKQNTFCSFQFNSFSECNAAEIFQITCYCELYISYFKMIFLTLYCCTNTNLAS